jgi:hypothetical protein
VSTPGFARCRVRPKDSTSKVRQETAEPCRRARSCALLPLTCFPPVGILPGALVSLPVRHRLHRPIRWGPRGWHAHRCARRRSNDDPQRTRRRKWRSGRNLRFAPQLLLAPPLRRRLRPRNRKRQPIAAAYAFRLPLRAQPRLSTHTVLQPQAVVPLATIKCSSAFDEKRFAKGTSLMFATPPGSQKELR